MNLDQINKWLTLSANICVIAGIVFLAIEIGQNTDATQASVEQSMMETDINLALFQAQARYNERNSQIELQNPTVVETLPAEFFYWVAFSPSRYHYWDQFRAGLLDQDTYDSYMFSFVGAALGNNPLARQTFLGLEQQFPQKFVDEIYRLWNEIYPGRELNSD